VGGCDAIQPLLEGLAVEADEEQAVKIPLGIQ